MLNLFHPVLHGNLHCAAPAEVPVPCANISCPSRKPLPHLAGCLAPANTEPAAAGSCGRHQRAGLGGCVTSQCMSDCLIDLSSPLGGVHSGQNNFVAEETLGEAVQAGGLTPISAMWSRATESQL